MNEQWREDWNLNSSDLLPSSLSFLWKAFSFQKDNALVHSLRSITYGTSIWGPTGTKDGTIW